MTQTFTAPETESLSQRVSRRLRGALAENRISQSALAKALHLPQQTLSRRLTGFTPFTVDELELVAQVLDVPLDAVLGLGDFAGRSIPPCGIVDATTREAQDATRE